MSSLNQNKTPGRTSGPLKSLEINTQNGRHFLFNNYLSMNMTSINSNSSTINTKTTGNQTNLITQGNYNLTTRTGNVVITSNSNSDMAIFLNATNSNGGITLNSGNGGIILDTTGPISFDTTGDITLGGSNTGNITLDSNYTLNLSSDLINLVATDNILIQTSSGGEIILDTNGTNTGSALRVSTDGNILINQDVAVEDYQVEIAVTDPSTLETNGLLIHSNVVTVSPEVRVAYEDPDGSKQVVNTLGVYASNSSYAKYRSYIGFQYGTQIVSIQGPIFNTNDIGKKVVFQQDDRTTTITGLSTIVLPVDSTFAPDTLTVGGTYTGSQNLTIKVEIDGLSPNTFRWSTTAGVSWNDTYIPIAWALNQRYPLGSTGIYVSFNDNGASTYEVGEYWIILAKITALVDSNLVINGQSALVSGVLGNVVTSVVDNIPVVITGSALGSNVIGAITSNMALSRVQEFYTNAPYSGYVGTVTNSDLVIKTANEERLRISADGSIGTSQDVLDGRLRLSSNFNAPLLVNDNIYVAPPTESSNLAVNLLGYQQLPASTDLNTGGYVVAYESQEWNTSNYNVYVNYFTSGGDKNGLSTRVNQVASNTQVEPHVAKSGDIQSDNYMVVWAGNTSNAADYQIYGQIYQNGTEPRQATDILIANTGSNINIAPRVTGLIDGRYVITFASANTTTSKYEVNYAVVNASGNTVSGLTRITADTGNNYVYPYVTALSNTDPNTPGGFVIAYQKQIFAEDPRYQLKYKIFTKSGSSFTASSEKELTNTGGVSTVDYSLTDGLVSLKTTSNGFLAAYSINYSGTYDYTDIVPPAVTVFGQSSDARANFVSASGPDPVDGTQTFVLDDVNGTFLEGEVIRFVADSKTFIEKIESITYNVGSIEITLSKDPRAILLARLTANPSTATNTQWRTVVNTSALVSDRLRDALSPSSAPLDFITQNTHFYAFRPMPVVTHNDADDMMVAWQNGFEPNIYYQRLVNGGARVGTEGVIAQTAVGLRQVDPWICPLRSSQGVVLGYSIAFGSGSLDLSKTGVFQQLVGPYSYLIHLNNNTAEFVVNNDGQMGVGTSEPQASIHVKSVAPPPGIADTAGICLQNNLTDRIETTDDTHRIQMLNGNGIELGRIKVKYSDNYQNMAPKADNLITYFKLDELQGSLVAQDSGIFSVQSFTSSTEQRVLIQTSQLVNFDVNTCWVTGKINNGLQFNGVDSVLLIPTPSSGTITGNELNNLLCRLGNNTGFAMAYWTKIDTNVNTGTRMDIFSVGSQDVGQASGGAVQFYLDDVADVGRLHPMIRYCTNPGTPTVLTALSTATRINDGEWHLLVFSYDTDTFDVWVDGENIYTSSALANPLVTVSTNLPVYIGSNIGGTGNPYRGVMDELRFYNTALAAADVARLYTYGSELRTQMQLQTLGTNSGFADYEPGLMLDDTGAIVSAKLKNGSYRQVTGTLACSVGSTTVIGLSTLFTQEIAPGDFLYIDNKKNGIDDTGDQISARTFKVIQIIGDEELVINRPVPSILSGTVYFEYVTVRPSIFTAVNIDNEDEFGLDFFGDVVAGSGKSALAGSKLEIRGTGQTAYDKTGLCLTNTAVASTYTDYGRNTTIAFNGFNTAGTETLLGKLSVNHAGTGSDNQSRMTIELNGANTVSTLNHVATFLGNNAINVGARNDTILGDFQISGYGALDTVFWSNQNAAGIFSESSNLSFYGTDSYKTDANVIQGPLARIQVSNDSRTAGTVDDQVPSGRIDFLVNNYANPIETGVGLLSRMSITASGNVGVHTQRPHNPLHAGPQFAPSALVFNSNIDSTASNTVVFDNDIFVTTDTKYQLLRGGSFEIFDGSNLFSYVIDKTAPFTNTRALNLTVPATGMGSVGSRFNIYYPGLHVNKWGLVAIGDSGFNDSETAYHLTVAGASVFKGEAAFCANLAVASSNTVALAFGKTTAEESVLQVKDNTTANAYVNLFRGPDASEIVTLSQLNNDVSWDYATILCNTSGNNVNLELPVTSAKYKGRKFTVKKLNSTNTVTINGNTAVIDGSATLTIATDKHSRVIQTDGTAWYVVAAYSP